METRPGMSMVILLCAGALAAGQAPRRAFLAGADISALGQLEKAGAVYRDGGEQRDALRILRDHGVNLFRVRLFVDPQRQYARTMGATQDLDDVGAMARRIKAAGGRFLLDLHYSDTWADPAHQRKPAAWEDLHGAALEAKVSQYTAEVLAALRQNGTPPDYVQVGNEIAAGMLWPDGRLDGKTPEEKERQWGQFARLVSAGSKAVRAASKDHQLVIHIHGGGRKGLPQWFFDNLKQRGVDYDIMAVSFYPFWDESIEDLRDNLRDLARTQAKDIIVMETAYPWRGDDRRKPTMRWPATAAGQRQFLEELLATVHGVPNGRGRGVVWWHPESVRVPGLRIWEGGACALFDDRGDALPAMNCFNQAAPRAANPLPFQYAEGQTALRREVRDPCIIREGDTYYLTFTMWPFRNREEKFLNEPNQGGSPGIALYSSKDLTDWKFENWLVKAAELPEDCPYKNRFWAPEIHRINGRFYLIFTADNWIKGEHNKPGKWGTAGYSFIGVADKVTGPYKHITYVEGGTCDMTLFGDSDGQVYAIKPKYDIYMQKIDLSRLGEGKVRFVGPERKVIACKNDDIGLATSPDYLEGPWMEKIDGRYFLFYAAIYKDKNFPEHLGYRTGVATAGKIDGPFAKDPRGHVFFGGHLGVFDGPDNRKWFSYRWEKDGRARGLLCVDPFEVDAGGRVKASESLEK